MIKKFFKGFLNAFAGISFLLGIIQILGGYDNCLYLFSKDFNNPFIISALAVLIISWLLLLKWVFLGNGAKTIIKFRSAFQNMPDNELGVKMMVLMSVAGGIAGLIFGIIMDVGSKFP